MAGPVEILIVLAGFGVVGLYLFIAHFFIAESERASRPRLPQTAGESHPVSKAA